MVSVDDPYSLREWWRTILRTQGKYPCYAVLPTLASDREANQFFRNIGGELHHISGDTCLVIVLGGDYFSFDEGYAGYNDEVWVEAISTQITEGECIQAAALFGIRLTQFPCIVFFQDIRSPDFALISLKDMTSDLMTTELREVFSLIKDVATDKCDILRELYKRNHKRAIGDATRGAFATLSSLGDKAIEAVIDAWVKSVIR